MERKINYLSICYTLFLILLFLSGSISGFFSEVLYFLAFLAPLAVGLLLTKEEHEGEKYLSLSKKDIKFTLPLVFPTVTVIMLISLLTSFIINKLTGAENSVDVGNSLIPALISQALLPAILEEALFRYLPLRLLGGHSRRGTVLLSAAFFALVHHNLFTIPYAFIAGVIFMAVDIACDSVIPSFILHFINNAISVGFLVYQENSAFAPAIMVILGVLSVLSAVFIFIDRRKYKEKLSYAFMNGEKFTLIPPVIALSTVCLFIAVAGIL